MKPDTDEVWAAKLAASLAQQLRLPQGNLWEPGISQGLLANLRDGVGREEAEATLRYQLSGSSSGWVPA